MNGIGMQGRAGKKRFILGAVEPVSDQGMADGRHMKAELVGAACLGHQAQEGEAVLGLQNFVIRVGRGALGIDAALQEGIGLNHRQRMVLQVALKNPAAVFRIAPHQRTYRVAYGTARSDLLGLAERGYLVCRRTHRAFEFTVNPGLRQLLETYQPSN